MSDEPNRVRFNIALLYRLTMRMHAMVPYYFARNGYAFPAWHYYLEMTRRCNLRCVMCQYINWLSTKSGEEQAAGELTTAEWRDVIDQIPRFSLITFTGGEPFMRRDFPELLAHASAKCRTHVISNATLLTDERARRFVELAPRRLGGVGLNFLGVSIDGPEDVHDDIRALPGAFQKSAQGLKHLIEFRGKAGAKCPLVHITTVIQERNLAILPRMPEVVADLGCDVLNLTLEVRNYELEGLGDIDPASFTSAQVSAPKLDPRLLAEALKQTRLAARRAHVELRMPDMPDDEIVKYYDGRMNLLEFRCGGAWTTVFVGRKGVVFPCWLKAVGNVREQRLKEIWNGPAFRTFRKSTRKHLYHPCIGCCLLMHKKNLLPTKNEQRTTNNSHKGTRS